MLYEKKMLILSGDGKGVVLIEKSAGGVRFSLRTFDLPKCGGLKAGIVTRDSVFVRDLPDTADPASVFSIETTDIDVLHFAVFDDRLRLYGTNSKRMWEANIMDLLVRHDRRAPVLDGTPTAALPPIANKPEVLPMPDGTGIPQSRLAIYGDDALAENDFYTPLDIGSRMPAVDKFLDEPRVLDGLAPRIVPPPNIPARELPQYESVGASIAQTSESAEVAAIAEKDMIEQDASAADASCEPVDRIENDGVGVLPVDLSETAAAESATVDVAKADEDTGSRETANRAECESVIVEEASATTGPVRASFAVAQNAAEETAAADAALTVGDRPCELTARWLKNRTKRMPTVYKETVKKPTANDRVKFLRESSFFERARHDIDTIFNNARKDETLSALLPDITWVRVDLDGHSISVGRSGNAFLCYAVAGGYEKISPLGDEAQWLPTQRDAPTGNGYWLIFQNLNDGEIIRG